MRKTRIRQNAIIILALLLFVLLVGVCDSLSGPDLSLSVFYLIPVALAAYFISFRTAFIISLFSSIVYLVADHFLSINYSRSAVPYWNAGVRLVFFVLVAYVLVKRKHAQSELTESEERFRLLVEGTRDCAMVMLDNEGKIINWNYGAERIYGYNSHEALSRHFSDLYPAEDVRNGKPGKDMQQAASEGKYIDEGWRSRKNGEQFWADVILTALRDGRGELRGFSLLTRDMTERRLSEQAVRLYAQLHEIDRSILAAKSSTEVAEQALVRLGRLIQFQAGSIALFNPENGKAQIIAAAGGSPIQTAFLMDAPEFDDIERLKLGVTNIVVDTDMSDTAWADTLSFSPVGSYINVPLLSHDHLIGLLNLGRKEHGGFDEEELKAARQVANQVALAINSARLLEELQAAHHRLRFLSQKMLEVQETEKRHLARELHDEMGQSLTALKIHMEEILSDSTQDRLTEHLRESVAILEKTMQQVRSLSLNLRPLVLDDLGLVAALRWYIARQSQLAGFQAHFAAKPEDLHLSPELETACFRIAQEALTNVVRHARAKSVNLSLNQRRNEVELKIKDDGIGFDTTEMTQKALEGENMGLLGMKERTLLLGGEIEVESFPKSGTEIRVRFPFRQPAPISL